MFHKSGKLDIPHMLLLIGLSFFTAFGFGMLLVVVAHLMGIV
jgi:hypothetical protein